MTFPAASRSRTSNRKVSRISSSPGRNFAALPTPATVTRRTTIEWSMTFEKTAFSPAEGKTHIARTVRAGFSGLVNANRSVTSAAGSPIDRGPATGSEIRDPPPPLRVASQVNALMLGMEKNSPPRRTLDTLMPRGGGLTAAPGNGENRLFFLSPDDRVTLAADPNEIAVVDPLLLQEFHRGHRLGADEQKDSTARDLIICFGQGVRIVWFSICRAAPDEAMDVDISQPGELRIPRVHASNMRSERYLPAVWIVRVIEVVVPLRIRTERGVVDVRRQRQRSAAAPTADQ